MGGVASETEEAWARDEADEEEDEAEEAAVEAAAEASAAAAVAAAASVQPAELIHRIDAFDCLTLHLPIAAPLDAVITPRAMSKYNQVCPLH